MRTTMLRLLALLAATGLVTAGCGGGGDGDAATTTTAAAAEEAEAAPANDTPAAGVRAALEVVLHEHVFLAAAATDAAVAGRQEEFDEAEDPIEENSAAFAGIIASVYGSEAGEAVGTSWRDHIDLLGEYALALRAGDQAAATGAAGELDGFAASFGAALAESTDGEIDADAIGDAVDEHVSHLVAVIDAQAAGDGGDAFARVSQAASHVTSLAEPLAAAIVEGHGETFPGSADDDAADLRAAMDTALQAHTYLVGATTDAALAGRGGAFNSAMRALSANTDSLLATLGRVYDQASLAEFATLWRQQIALFTEYATGASTGDKTRSTATAAALTALTPDLGAAIETLTAGALPGAGIAPGLQQHVGSVVTIVDAQASGAPHVLAMIRDAAQFATQLADQIAATMVRQFPEEFGG